MEEELTRGCEQEGGGKDGEDWAPTEKEEEEESRGL